MPSQDYSPGPCSAFRHLERIDGIVYTLLAGEQPLQEPPPPKDDRPDTPEDRHVHGRSILASPR